MSLAFPLLAPVIAQPESPLQNAPDPEAQLRAVRRLAEERALRTPGWDRPVATPTAADSGATFVRSPYFPVPVHIHPADRHKVRELHLHVSYDRGRTWALHERAAPGQFVFDYFAPRDGLYHFTVVVTDDAGRREPADLSATPADARVIVDATPPRASLKAEKVRGRVEVSWAFDEEHPAEGGVELTYTPYRPRSKNCQRQLPVGAGATSGRARFEADPECSHSVSLTVRDRAGNGTTETVTLKQEVAPREKE